jgi:hypothetical protein
MKQRIFWYGAAVWEALRFVILYTHSMLLLDPANRAGAGLLLLWFGAAQLGLAGLCFFAGADPARSGILRGLYVLAKALTGLPAVMYTAVRVGMVFMGEPVWPVLPAVAVLIVDALFLTAAPWTRPEKVQPEASTLPELEITRLEED